MNIVFIGTVKFSLEMLNVLLLQGAKVTGVVTSEDRGINSDHTDLEPLCIEKNIPVLFTDDVNSGESVSWISHCKPDVIFCMGWSRLIKSELLNLPRMGVIGYHPAALPSNRGRHPLIWALVLGLDKTASTFFFMDEGADSGDILDQEEISIDETDDASNLYEKMTKTAKEQLVRIYGGLISGRFSRTPQDHSKANTWRKRSVKDGMIDWRMSAVTINNLVRGLTTPYIGAEFSYAGNSYKVWKAGVIEAPGYENIEPGKVIDIRDDVIVVKCAEGAIELLSFEPELTIRKGEYL